MRIACRNTKPGRFPLEEDLRRCLAHHNKSGGLDGAAKNGEQPEIPAPAVASCEKAADNRAEYLATTQSSASNGEGDMPAYRSCQRP